MEFAAMPKRKDLHVIPGGKSGSDGADDAEVETTAVSKLLERADNYRNLLSLQPDEEISSLVTDMTDAIEALRLLENSTAPDSERRALEYRGLIAELEIEIVAALEAP